MIRTVAPKIVRVSRTRTLSFRLLTVFVGVSIGSLFVPDPAHAATLRINPMRDAADNNSTDGECATEPFRLGIEPTCTFRAAVGEANANGQRDTIVFDPALGGTIILKLRDLVRLRDAPSLAPVLSYPCYVRRGGGSPPPPQPRGGTRAMVRSAPGKIAWVEGPHRWSSGWCWR